MLLGAICIQAPALTAFVISIRSGGSTWILAGLAFLAGAGEPQVGGSLRALWTILLPTNQRHVGLALSSILFEIPVVVGPLLLFGLLMITSTTTAALIACLCFVIGAGLLATSRAARAWRPAPGGHHSLLGPLASSGVRLVTAIATVQGLVTGLLQVSCAAFAEQQAAPQSTAILYALLSSGSLLGTMVYGARHRGGSATVRLAALLGLLAAVLAAGALAASSWLLWPVVFVAGTLLGPVAICSFTEAERHAPPGTLAGAFTTLIAAALAATATGSALAGWIIDRGGPTSALATATVITLVPLAILPLRFRTAGGR